MKNSKIKKSKNNKFDNKKPELTTQDKLSEIIKFKPNKTTTHELSIAQQIDTLKNNKNCKIDTKLNKILKNRNLSQVYTPYESLFSKFKVKNIPVKSDIKNHQIRKEHNLGLRQEIIIDDDFSINSIKKLYQSENKNDYDTHKFSDVWKLNKNDEKLNKKLYSKIKNIELILKTKISEFIESESIKSNTSWSSWILKNIPEFMSTREKSELIDFLYKNNLYKNKIDDGIDEMTLGKLKTTANIIFHTNDVSPLDRDFFCDELFNGSLNLGLDLDNIKYYEIVGKLITLNRLRNSIAHADSFNTFLLKELVEQIKHMSRKEHLNLRFWFVKNQNSDKSIGIFIDNYLSNIESKTGKDLNYLKEKLHNSHTDSIKIGYHIEIENLNTKNTKCLDLDILYTLSWWFKSLKHTKNTTTK